MRCNMFQNFFRHKKTAILLGALCLLIPVLFLVHSTVKKQVRLPVSITAPNSFNPILRTGSAAIHYHGNSSAVQKSSSAVSSELEKAPTLRRMSASSACRWETGSTFTFHRKCRKALKAFRHFRMSVLALSLP